MEPREKLVFAWVAFAAWCATAAGLLSASMRRAHVLADLTAGHRVAGRRG